MILVKDKNFYNWIEIEWVYKFLFIRGIGKGKSSNSLRDGERNMKWYDMNKKSTKMMA